MWNLLSNSVKFTPRGGSVTVNVEREEGAVRIEIADTGQGIAPDFLPHVFERFRQQESSNTRAAGGLGLGLAIVRELVNLHGGSVEALSEGSGKGATFKVTLATSPMQAEVSAVASPSSQSSGPLQSPPELEGSSALVVDDEADARDVVQTVLEGAGVTVHTASSVDEALAYLAHSKPDVVVCDISMPARDGYDFIQALRGLPREQGGRIPAVALTAHARSEDRRKALACGFQNHAAKPVEPQELLLVVANLLGRYA
jgi:CheY-like chemotaxis protein